MSNTSEKLLTVLMPVYNGEKYLNTAINSILNQTYANFEFLIINDGSTDRSGEIVNSYSDRRIIYVKSENNKGIVATLNTGLEIGQGKYIARMDADDIAHPDRLERQLNFMLSHPECKLCGTRAIAINENGQEVYKLKRPYLKDDIKVQHLFRNSFIHPSAILDAEVARSFKYSSHHQYAEDYYLFSQIAMNHEIANLEGYLLYYRVHPENITAKKQYEMNESEMETMNYLLSNLFDRSISDKEVFIHHSFLTRNFEKTNVSEIEAHLLKIKDANNIKQIYDCELLAVTLQKEWFNFLFFSKEKSALSQFKNSKLFSFRHFNFRQFIKLATKK